MAKPHEPNEIFRSARERLFGTREALAEAANVHLPRAYELNANDIGKIERGVVTYPRPPRRAALRKVLGVTTDGEIGFSDSRRSSSSARRNIDANSTPQSLTTAVEGSLTIGQRTSDQNEGEDVTDILHRITTLKRTIDSAVLDTLQENLRHVVTQYESLEHGALGANLRKQRYWIGTLLDECRQPAQQQQLFHAGATASGLLGYVAVGRGDFPTGRAYCLEAFTMAELAADSNLQAWARGLQSFCEYYSRNYRAALDLAVDGLSYAQSGPQSVRLTINGMARAMGKLGDQYGVQRAVDEAFDLLSRNDPPLGVPSSISLECYSTAQTASNAATAFVSLKDPENAKRFANLALPDISRSSSPWSRSLIFIDLASSVVCSPAPDLEHAAAVVVEALTISRQRPIFSVRQRVQEFLGDATDRWGATRHTDAIREAAEMSDAQP